MPTIRNVGWRSLSLFSGCGGLDLGFLQEGIFSAKAFDLDQGAVNTYQHNFSQVINKTDLSRITPIYKNCEVLLAGAPCQGFSTAGKRYVKDPRNDLLMKIADVALANRPKIIVVENVPAALSGLHKKLWVSLEDCLRLAGYNVRRLLLDGARCGISQRRKRLFLLCWTGSDCININLPNLGSITLREALGGMPEAAEDEIEWPLAESKHAKIIKHINPGQKLSNVRLSDSCIATWDIPEVYGFVSDDEKEALRAVARLRRRERVRSFGDGDPVSRFRLERYLEKSVANVVPSLINKGFLKLVEDKLELTQTYNGRYRRLNWKDISPTVDTRFGRVDLFVHPEQNRGMTLREAARIQGFPDTFHFCGARKEQFTQIGNAVPPPMAAVLAKFIREAILKA